MYGNSLKFWKAFEARDDLEQFGNDALLLFAMQLRFGIEDISLLASNALTEGPNDKKTDLVYIDTESRYAVIAQTYISQDKTKKEAPANKASDLNTAISWLLNSPISELPQTIKSSAIELRKAIDDGNIRYLNVWYVHNLLESQNVRNELDNVEHAVDSIVKTKFSSVTGIDIQAQEVGINTLEEWYESISTPILVTDDFTIPISGGFEIKEADWMAYVTSIPASWLYQQFKLYKTKLLSANVREYLGSRSVDNNINNGIKWTAGNDPEHFWVYNNGITALVLQFQERIDNKQKELYLEGMSIINGAQTVGAIGNLNDPPHSDAMVQVRFITCTSESTVYNVVRYNNTQNKITAPDFRSNDATQRRLLEEFQVVPDVDYLPRRGGHEDVIKRRPNALPSVTAGQALAAFHGDPGIAYHQKTHMWEDDTLYSTYFGSHTSARHIIFACSLLKAVEQKKLSLRNKSKDGDLINIEEKQLDFFRERGSTFMMVSAIARCLEIILGKALPSMFTLTFKTNFSIVNGSEKWAPIVDVASAFAAYLEDGLADGFKTTKIVEDALQNFQSFIAGTKHANSEVYSRFTNEVK